MFDHLNLSHKSTLNRVQFLLSQIDGQDVFDREDLDRLCGQRNKPLGRLLRRTCFIRVPEVVGTKSGERYVYRKFPRGVSELTKVLVTYQEHASNIGLGAE
jgi:hypothetical protein